MPTIQSQTVGWKRSHKWWLGLLLVLIYLPLLGLYFRDLWLREHYRFVPLYLVLVSMIGWRRWREAPTKSRAKPVGRLIIVFGLAFVLVGGASFLQSPALAFLSAMLAIGGGLIVAARTRAMTHAFAVWCLLWLGFRLPFELDLQVITAFQTLTTAASSRFLDGFHVVHLADGHVLSFPGKDFFVDEACSGVMSFMALVAMGALLAVMQKRAVIHGMALVLFACAWALISNMLRVLTVAVIYVKSGHDVSVGWAHQVLGLGTFGFAVVGILSSDRLLKFLLGPTSLRSRTNGWVSGWNRFARWGESRPAGSRASTVSASDLPRSWSRYGAAALALLLGFQLTVGAFDRQSMDGHRGLSVLPVSPKVLLKEDSIRPANTSWKRVGFDHIQRQRQSAWGEQSLIWTFQHDDTVVRLALDYPFYGHHDLRVCYAGRGWRSLHRGVIGEDRSTAEIDLYKAPTNEHAYSLAGAIGAAGEWLPWPKASIRERVTERFLMDRTGETSRQTYYQLQAFIVSGHRLGSFQRADLRDAFDDFQKQISNHFRRAYKPELQ